jgi:hypothetical protein
MAANLLKIESRWVFLWVKAGAEYAERRIFRQDKSSGPRGPNAISKALDRRWHRHVHWQRLARPKSAAHPAQVASFCPVARASGPHQCLTAFSH